MSVARSDLEKLEDVVRTAVDFHKRRDEMNAAVHLAPAARYSPLTAELEGALDRLGRMIEEVGDEEPAL